MIVNIDGYQVLIDDDEMWRLDKYTYHVRKQGNTRWYVIRRNRKNGAIFLHREINKTPDGMDTDHIDGNGLNNTKINLRCCSRSENLYNRGRAPGNTTGIKGVIYDKGRNAWRAEIKVDKKHLFLGRYRNKWDAKVAYQIAAIELHGEYANCG